MKRQGIKVLHSKSVAELTKEAQTLRKELVSLRLVRPTSEKTNVHKASHKRRNLAQILTILTLVQNKEKKV